MIPKLEQLLAVHYLDDDMSALLGLDPAGRLWQFEWDDHDWELLAEPPDNARIVQITGHTEHVDGEEVLLLFGVDNWGDAWSIRDSAAPDWQLLTEASEEADHAA